jgi:ribosomal protein L37AE/L43A
MEVAMTAQEPAWSNNRRPAGNDKHPACPKCSRPMTVKRIVPVLFASAHDDMIFGCDECGTEIKRTAKRG